MAGIPLSLVRCLLQQGLSFSEEVLESAARHGRSDILQLAFSSGHASRITADMISIGAAHHRWPVVVWAARNNIALDLTRLLAIVNTAEGRWFAFRSQRAELRSYLTQLRDNHATKSQKRKR